MKKSPALLLLLIAFILTALPASAAPPTITGAWLVALTSDSSGEEVTSAYTFGREGIMSASVDLEGVTAGQGAWKRSGPRTFTATFVSFIPDGNSATTTINKNTAKMKVSRDGESFDIDFRFEIIVNGTVVSTGTSSGSGVRIVPEPF